MPHLRRHPTIAAALVLISLTPLATAATPDTPPPLEPITVATSTPAPPPVREPADPRAAIALTAVQRSRLEAEMRAHLDAVHAVIAALAADDWDGVAAAALRRNAAGDNDRPGSDFRRQLPPVWFRMATPMNRHLDVIAEEARGQRRATNVLTELGRATEFCASCHATFRIVTEPAR